MAAMTTTMAMAESLAPSASTSTSYPVPRAEVRFPLARLPASSLLGCALPVSREFANQQPVSSSLAADLKLDGEYCFAGKLLFVKFAVGERFA